MNDETELAWVIRYRENNGKFDTADRYCVMFAVSEDHAVKKFEDHFDYYDHTHPKKSFITNGPYINEVNESDDL